MRVDSRLSTLSTEDDVDVDRDRPSSVVGRARHLSPSVVHRATTMLARARTPVGMTTTVGMTTKTTTATRAGKTTNGTIARARSNDRRSIVVRSKKASEKGDCDEANGEKSRAHVAAFVACAMLLTQAVDADVAEAARSGGRVGGGSFRASSRASPRMSAQSRAAPALGGYGGYNSVFMPVPIMPMYGFGYGFGFGGLGFIFNVMFFLFVVNFVLSFLQSFQKGNDSRDRRDDDEF